ncbi:L-seryl-tRNA(Sec) selenium transferase [Streptosporangium sp. NPDC050855]|uniref:L-seryl-tRNA(Sec) selenium transferase n=1 Tax=Streptosporangium sp. NPDC050855 TaxID=3366194 RepID=UPI0037B33E27
MNGDPRRALPKMDVVLAHPRIAEQMSTWGRPLMTEAARRALEQARHAVTDGRPPPSLDDIAHVATGSIAALTAGRLRAVINATGVVLHTNLGRAPLSEAARKAVDLATGYSTVEFDLRTGGRGKRGATAHALLRELTGAPGALVVNNAAAALFLALGALARGRQVLVSRGELVEIGGEFRIPSIMEAAGVELVEVGSTNRTHLADYADAIDERTALLMVVHPSNYRIEGFTAQPPLADLVRLARKAGIPLLHDIGSGLLRGRLGDEPTLRDSLGAGADLAVFSGDKLFGGPQAGLLVGRADLVGRLARHPVARAVRIDKLTLAALEATLQTHLSGRLEELPVWRMLTVSLEALRARAGAMARALGDAASLRDGASVAGGGSLPGEGMPSVLIRIDPRPVSETTVVARLRAEDPPVIARAERGHVIVDLRTVPPEQDDTLLRSLRHAIGH